MHIDPFLPVWSAFERDKYGASGIGFWQNIFVLVILGFGTYMFAFSRRRKS